MRTLGSFFLGLLACLASVGATPGTVLNFVSQNGAAEAEINGNPMTDRLPTLVGGTASVLQQDGGDFAFARVMTA